MRKEIEELFAECWLEAISSGHDKTKDFISWYERNKYKIDLLKFDI
jgi:hypothetical protein